MAVEATSDMNRRQIETALENTGLICRGGFNPGPEDRLPEQLGAIGTVVLIGNAGPAMWQEFSGSPEYGQGQGGGEPLDTWSRRILDEVAGRLDAKVVYPFDGPPYFPFQRWAIRSDQVWQSPIGALVHPHHGLWHAYRGALLFAERLDFRGSPKGESPCESCTDQPCLQTCPVGAFSVGRYDVAACTRHVGSAAGRDCMDRGCLARRACPLGRDHHYGPAQARFHMDHFLRRPPG